MPTRTLVPPDRFDLRRTMRTSGAGRFSPDGAYWYSTRTPHGPGALCVERLGGALRLEAWGPGATHLLDSAPRLLGLDDRPDRFPAPEGLLRDLHLRSLGMHLGATGAVYEAIVPVVLGQLVTTTEARAGFRALVRGLGAPAPGPRAAPRLVPSPSELAAADYAELHRFGIERKRAVILIECARRAVRLEESLGMDGAAARVRLAAVRGVGPWTVESVMGVAHGDRDAVPVGDHNLPHMVAWALAGEPRGSDARMLQLLEPYRPMRRRAVMLLKQSGLSAPRYGPRLPVRSHL